MSKVKIGDKVPAFSLKNEENKVINSKDYLGHGPLVIYFYPKDNTAGCTREACSFRDAFEDLSEAGAKVFGISSDSPASHLRFKKNNRLPFTLLSDPGKKVQKLFGVPTNLFGLIPGRVTYVIDQEGLVQHIFNSQMQVEKHAQEALKALQKMKKS